MALHVQLFSAVLAQQGSVMPCHDGDPAMDKQMVFSRSWPSCIHAAWNAWRVWTREVCVDFTYICSPCWWSPSLTLHGWTGDHCAPDCSPQVQGDFVFGLGDITKWGAVHVFVLIRGGAGKSSAVCRGEDIQQRFLLANRIHPARFFI